MTPVRSLRTALIVGLAMVPVSSYALYRADLAEREAVDARALSLNADARTASNAAAARDLAEVAEQEQGTSVEIGRRALLQQRAAQAAAKRGEASAAGARGDRGRAWGHASAAQTSAAEAQRLADDRLAGEEVSNELPTDEPLPTTRRPAPRPGFRMGAAPTPFHVAPGRP